MNSTPMSSTTEESDWKPNIIPRPRQPSTISLTGSFPKSQSQLPPPQPVYQRSNGPGQSVFPVAARGTFRLQNSQSQIPLPQPQFPHVNPYPYPAPSFAAPIPMNPALARVINETPPRLPHPPQYRSPPGPYQPIQSSTTPSTTIGPPATPPVPNPPQQSTPQDPTPNPVMDMAPEYVTPPSRSIRGVKRGAATRARGGRKPRIKVETPDAGDTSSITSKPTSGRGSGRARARGGRVNRGGRPRGSRAGASSSRGVKRKREDDDEKESDSDVSEIITPLPTQSRSGRKITHASTFSPIVIDLEEKEKKSMSSLTVPATRSANTSAVIEPTRGRGNKRFSRPGEASVCKNCGRGHSPASNMIVFCDGCNGPWHQYCHDPPISSEVVRIEEQEWFCADCLVLREEKAHVEGKVSAEALSVVEVSLQPIYCFALEHHLNVHQKRRYLQSLPSAQLVSLLLHATILHPELPIFATASGGPLPERPRRPITHFVDPTAPAEEEDESYDLYPNSEVLPYPKAGNGIPLPRESDYLSMLIDEDVGVYSHVWDWKKRGLDRNDATG